MSNTAPRFREILLTIDDLIPPFPSDSELTDSQTTKLRRINQAAQETGDVLAIGLQSIGQLLASRQTSECPPGADDLLSLGWFIREISEIVYTLKFLETEADYALYSRGAKALRNGKQPA